MRFTRRRAAGWIGAGLAMLLVGGAALLWMLGTLEDATPPATSATTPADVTTVQRGAYLARAADCVACHSAADGTPYAGGRRIETPFGVFVSPNITPDRDTGIGAWSADDFWRALHHGKGRDGKLLYPVFPYTEYTRMTRADSDAIHAWLQTLAPVHQVNAAHDLPWPYRWRPALAVWRALFFRPATFAPDPGRSAEWNRGAYLARGPGHCASCHAARNAWGATDLGAGLSGGPLPAGNWYAPSLNSNREAGLGDWPLEQIVALLHTGVSARGAVFGPMAEVVRESLQYLTDADMRALAVYLKALPDARVETERVDVERDGSDDGRLSAVVQRGAQVYKQHCADCHGADGLGATGAYPPLAGNQALTMASPANAIGMVLRGGFTPTTAGNPRPYGMPPFDQALSRADVAAVVTYLRNAWGQHAPIVTEAEVDRFRGKTGD